ncbi:MAG: hypothetical protein KAI44_04000 [Methylococcales bacterium]|nr:hypothetical protein [Methylococcales bacterium]
MNNSESEIDSWLIAGVPGINSASDEVWESGFEADRQIVLSKFGPYQKIFLRPEKFIKRFYHSVYPLTIEEWQCTEQVKLYDDFCTMDIALDVRFQATFNYAVSNMEILSELNEHIKSAYYGLAIDIVNRELLNLSDGGWVQDGLEAVEKKIGISISEMLILQNIQSQVVCKLKPSFEKFPDVQFAKETVYLCVLKKSFEFSDQEKEELFRQQQEQEKQKIEHKRKQLKRLNQVAEVDRQKQALDAENNKRFLKQREKLQLEQFEIKKKIHADRIKHNNKLKEMTFIAELEEKARLKAEERASEEEEKLLLITHQVKLKQKELESEIGIYEREQESWREAKDKTHTEELDLKHRQKQLEFDTDVGYKKRYELQRLAMQEESFAARKKSDVYLKREIELLELEKQRLALKLSIKDFKNKDKKDER